MTPARKVRLGLVGLVVLLMMVIILENIHPVRMWVLFAWHFSVPLVILLLIGFVLGAFAGWIHLRRRGEAGS